MGYTNSSLVNYTRLSPNHSGQRTSSIYIITPHCVVGQCSVETLGNIFAPTSREASCNYGIGSDGRVGMYVEEKNRSWCTSSNWNDQRAITIECASDLTEPYAFNSTVYNKLVDLCVDICKRNGKTKLTNPCNSSASLQNYKPAANEMVLSAHRWWDNKSCPGNWMYSRFNDLCAKVNAKLGSSGGGSSTPTTKEMYRVRKSWADAKSQVGAFEVLANAKKECDKHAGYHVFNSAGKAIYPEAKSTPTPAKKSVDELAKEVIQGKWGNGDERKKKLEAAGYNYNSVQSRVNELMNGSSTKKSVDQIAKEVIQGKWGNGSERKRKLTQAGYNYDEVQSRVNKLMGY